MSDRHSHVLDFYTRHPISAEQIVAKLRADGATWIAFTQDHYGGLAANEALAERAGICKGAWVADFCAGLGGPARYWAHRFGAHVVGIDLNPSRVLGAAELTALVGLGDQARVIEGDVTRTGLPSGSFDVVVSQEAFLHLPDKAAALAEAFRLLRPGGRLAFTDWVVHRPLLLEEAETMWRGIAAQTLQSTESYGDLLHDAGLQRFAMYRKLREETLRQGLPAADEEFYIAYGQLVELVKARVLGGGRFAAEKPSD